MSGTNGLQGLQAALEAIRAKWAQYPGRAPNGTGPTGLLPNDAQGYSDMLNEQTEGLNDENALAGKGPVAVHSGRDSSSEMPVNAEDEALRAVAGGPFGRFGAGTGGQSASLRGLRKARA